MPDIVEFSKDDSVVYITQSAFARVIGVSRQAINEKVKRGTIQVHESGRIPVLKSQVILLNGKLSWKPYYEYDGVRPNYQSSAFYKMTQELETLPTAVCDIPLENRVVGRNSKPKPIGRKIA